MRSIIFRNTWQRCWILQSTGCFLPFPFTEAPRTTEGRTNQQIILPSTQFILYVQEVVTHFTAHYRGSHYPTDNSPFHAIYTDHGWNQAMSTVPGYPHKQLRGPWAGAATGFQPEGPPPILVAAPWPRKLLESYRGSTGSPWIWVEPRPFLETGPLGTWST